MRQDCSLSYYLFNVFIEEAVQELKVKAKVIKIDGKVICYIRFADNIAMLTETGKALQQSLDIFNEILKRYLIKVNINKIKVKLR